MEPQSELATQSIRSSFAWFEVETHSVATQTSPTVPPGSSSRNGTPAQDMPIEPLAQRASDEEILKDIPTKCGPESVSKGGSNKRTRPLLCCWLNSKHWCNLWRSSGLPRSHLGQRLLLPPALQCRHWQPRQQLSKPKGRPCRLWLRWGFRHGGQKDAAIWFSRSLLVQRWSGRSGFALLKRVLRRYQMMTMRNSVDPCRHCIALGSAEAMLD